MEVSANTVKKYYQFLVILKANCDSNNGFSLFSLTKEHHVSKSLSKPLQRLKIIRNEGSLHKPMWKWLQGEPTLIMARKAIEEINKNAMIALTKTRLRNIELKKQINKEKEVQINEPIIVKTVLVKPKNKPKCEIEKVGIIRKAFRWLWCLIPLIN